MNYKDYKTELILTSQEKIYHLTSSKVDLSTKIILVGDPERANFFSSFLDSIRFESKNREYQIYTGSINSVEVSIISTGIGVGNMDIVMNELDAIFNVDFQTFQPKKDLIALNIVRIGTCGTVQEEIKVGTAVISDYAVGTDNLFSFYPKFEGNDELHTLKENLDQLFKIPYYVVKGDEGMITKLSKHFLKGITLCALGFYAPQNRFLRLLNTHVLPSIEEIRNFELKGNKFVNIEMECSLLYGFAHLMNHHAITVDLVLANRTTGEFLYEYKKEMEELFKTIIHEVFE